MPILVSKYEEPLVPYSDLISINQPNMTSKGNDFAGTLSNEFVLPTNKTVGAYRVIGEDGQCSHLLPDSHTQKHLHLVADRPSIYLAGNSLGALSRRSEKLVQDELHAWATV